MSVMLRRLWIQISGDRKRFGILCIVLAVGLLFWARLIVISRAPRTVMADDADPPAVTNTEPKADNAPAPLQRLSLDRQPVRDPFVISSRHFPEPDPVLVLAPEPGKSSPQHAEDPQQIEQRRMAELQKLVDGFTLDAVMTRPPMAVINGRMFRLGASVSAIDNQRVQFTLAEVSKGRVVLECEDRQFELKMETAAPGG